MDLQFNWLEPFQLVDGAAKRLTYCVSGEDEARLPVGPGVYIFGRRHGRDFSPVYVGKAVKLNTRLWQQFNNNRLMNSLRDAPNGSRELLIAEFVGRRGQQPKRVLPIVERGLIKLALAQDYEIVNKHGTRIRSHAVEMSGSRDARSWLPKRHVQFE